MYSSWGWNKRPVFRICQSFCVQAGILCYRAKPLDSQTVSEVVLVLSRVLNSRHHLQQLSEITESPNGSYCATRLRFQLLKSFGGISWPMDIRTDLHVFVRTIRGLRLQELRRDRQSNRRACPDTALGFMYVHALACLSAVAEPFHNMRSPPNRGGVMLGEHQPQSDYQSTAKLACR
jgi:hypothetical protein